MFYYVPYSLIKYNTPLIETILKSGDKWAGKKDIKGNLQENGSGLNPYTFVLILYKIPAFAGMTIVNYFAAWMPGLINHIQNI